MKTPTILDGKRLLIVDEVSRTGSTLRIAEFLFKAAIPEIAHVEGTYFWHPKEPVIKAGSEYMLTSVPVWYDPSTSIGRGIGELNEDFYRRRYEYYRKLSEQDDRYDLRKLRTQAFAASVFSAPHLNPDGTLMSLEAEKVSRELGKELRKLSDDFKSGKIFFTPPSCWRTERNVLRPQLRGRGACLFQRTHQTLRHRR